MKLQWHVEKNPDGSFVRRRIENDTFDLEHIDVVWTHADGFPPDTKRIPITHPPDIEYKEVECGTREKIPDMISVGHHVTDSTIAVMLDEKRIRLANSLKVSP